MSDDDVCAICEGGGGWWQLEPDADTWRLVECEHCDRTGIEPDPGVMPTPTVEEYLSATSSQRPRLRRASLPA